MCDHAKSKRTAYTIYIQGWLPADLGDKISRLHASALLDGRNLTAPKVLVVGLESRANRDAEPQVHISDAV